MQNINSKTGFLFLPLMLAVLLFTSTGCDEDSFSQVVEVEVPEHKSSIVLNGIWNSQDTLLQLVVSNSLSILDDDEFTVPQDADVKLFKDNTLLGNLAFNQQTFKYEYALDTPLGSSVATYRIEAAFDDYDPVSVEQEMPGTVELTEVKYEKEGTIDPSGEKVDEYTITFSDPGDVENYYIFTAFVIDKYVHTPGDTIVNKNMVYLQTNDPIASYSNRGLIFSDKAFNGNEYTLTGWDYGWWSENLEFEFRLTSISKDGFLYLKSLDAYYNSEGNPFAQPATVYNNIENGYGIFALGASDVKVIK